MNKRRQFSPEFKAKVVLELISGKKGLMEASREYGIKDSLLSRWKNQLLTKAPQVFERNQKQVDPKDEEIAELERTLGKMTMQLEIAKKVLGNTNYPEKQNES